MQNVLKALPTVIIGLSIAAMHYQPISAEGDSSESSKDGETSEMPLIFAWILKPPYTTSPTNGSFDKEAHGLIRDALLSHITLECGYYAGKFYQIHTSKVNSEFEMLELLRQNKAHVAVPIFEDPTNRRYGEFPFLKLVDYPGTEYITLEDNHSVLSVALDAVLKAWPLLAVTIVLTAIAGIIIWALVGNCHSIFNNYATSACWIRDGRYLSSWLSARIQQARVE